MTTDKKKEDEIETIEWGDLSGDLHDFFLEGDDFLEDDNSDLDQKDDLDDDVS